MTLARNQAFQIDREPPQHVTTLQLNNDKSRGPVSFLNPTRAYFNSAPAENFNVIPDPGVRRAEVQERRSGDHVPTDGIARAKVQYKWTTRNNRKGRHVLVVQAGSQRDLQYITPPPTSDPGQVVRGIGRMFTYFPVWDITYLVAVIFALGSLIWLVNAFFVFLPLAIPASWFPREVIYGGGYTAFIGATVFEFGSLLLMLEAVNENRTGCFG